MFIFFTNKLFSVRTAKNNIKLCCPFKVSLFMKIKFILFVLP